MEVDDGGLNLRALCEKDRDRLVAIDEVVSGRRREAWFEGRLRRVLEDSDIHISLGAESDGILVGAILGTVQYGEFGQAEPTAILDTLLVDRAFSRRGIASALLTQLLQNLSALRIRRLRTQVAWDELELIAFFGKSGFQPAARIVLELDVEAGLRGARAREDGEVQG